MDTNYKIVFLVPIFEAADCVEDLINNIHTICPNSAILFHVNLNSSEEYYNNIQKLINYYDFCYICPARYPSDWGHGYLALIYIQMMAWCLQNLHFEYVYLTASNSLLVNPQLENNINQHECYFYNPGIKQSGDWWEYITKDEDLFKYIEQYDNIVYVAIIEGAAFNKDITKLFVDELLYKLKPKRLNYPTEEYWIPTAFQNLKHRFNYKAQCLERWSHGEDWVMKEFQLNAIYISDYVFDLILSGKFDILSKFYIYSLKRIPRQYDDSQRTAIRQQFNYNNIWF